MRIRFKPWARPELEASSFYRDNPEELKNKWIEEFKNKNNPIHLELGCGKGQFISKLAVQNPNINYIAIDLVDAMLGLAKRNIEEVYAEKNEEINNVLISRYDIDRILNVFDETTKGKIAETTWKVGGNTADNIVNQPAKTAYQNEVVQPNPGTTSNGETEANKKIGLMYASDYGFAAASSAWTTNLYYYDGEAIKSANWMYLGATEWTISRNADYDNGVLYVYDSGSSNDTLASLALAVRPVYYLSSSVNYASGSGSATDPISIN